MSANDGRVTATIETVTAEVKTLVVGSRQITLSVAKQLDRVELEDLEVMGRVRVGSESNLVIGRNRADGALSLATYSDLIARPSPVVVFAEDLGRPVMVCQSEDRVPVSIWPEGYRETVMCFQLGLAGRAFYLDHGAAVRCGIGTHSRAPRYAPNDLGLGLGTKLPQESCGSWFINGQEEAIVDALKSGREWSLSAAAVHKAAQDAPLIVLAGLR